MRIDLEPLDPDLRALLATARQRDAENTAFDDEACERLLARVEHEIGAGSAAPSTTAFGLRLGSPGPIVAACAALALATAIGASMREPGDAPIPPPSVVEPALSGTSAAERTPPPPGKGADEPSAVTTVSVDELPSLAARPLPSAARVAKPVTSKEVEDTARKLEGALSADLAAELQLVDAARAAIAKQHHAEALRLLAEHEASFPNGQLAQQRERLWIQALVATGDKAQARSRAATFRQRHPSGLLLPAVERALDGDDAHAP